MRTFAIGDIHGCKTALAELLNKVQPSSDDQVVFLGDYIDRGPASRQVVERLLDLRKSCLPVFIRGNHEVMVLDAREDSLKANLWQSYGGLETLYSYSPNNQQDWVSLIPEVHWEFFKRTLRFFETDTHIFVHACLDPELDLNDQPDWLLYWEYFERLQPHKSGKRIVCGHTPQHSGEISNVGFAVCIDTGAGTGGWLTCLEASSGKFWQANEKGLTRQGVV
jgi:serine/threonine protein phosphatase 1